MRQTLPTKTYPSGSVVRHRSSTQEFHYAPLSTETSHHVSFHYSPLSTPSEQEPLDTTTFYKLSNSATTATQPINTSFRTQTSAVSPIATAPAPEVSLWFKIFVLVWLVGLLAIAVLLYVEEVWPRRAKARAGEEDSDGRIDKDDAVQSPTTALENRHKDLQDVRKRRTQNGETVVVGHLGSESRPPDWYAEPTADVEAYTPWKHTTVERAEFGLGIRNVGLSPSASPVSAPILSPAVQHGGGADGRMSIGCLGRILEMMIEFAIRKWRSEVGEDVEEGLLLPVRNEEKEDGELGRSWTAGEMKAR